MVRSNFKSTFSHRCWIALKMLPLTPWRCRLPWLSCWEQWAWPLTGVKRFWGHEWTAWWILVVQCAHLEKYEFVKWEGWHPIYEMEKNVWNHQPEKTYKQKSSFEMIWLLNYTNILYCKENQRHDWNEWLWPILDVKPQNGWLGSLKISPSNGNTSSH